MPCTHHKDQIHQSQAHWPMVLNHRIILHTLQESKRGSKTTKPSIYFFHLLLQAADSPSTLTLFLYPSEWNLVCSRYHDSTLKEQDRTGITWDTRLHNMLAFYVKLCSSISDMQSSASGFVQAWWSSGYITRLTIGQPGFDSWTRLCESVLFWIKASATYHYNFTI